MPARRYRATRKSYDIRNKMSSYAGSIGLSNTVENQGAATPSSYIGSGNLIIPYEGAGLPSISSLSAYPRSETAVIAFSVPSLDTNWLNQAKLYTSYVYVTDAGLPNPYDVLPSYFGSLVAALSSPVTVATTTVTTNGQPTTVIQTVNGPTTTETVQGPTTTYTTTVTTTANAAPSPSALNLTAMIGGLFAIVGSSVVVREEYL